MKKVKAQTDVKAMCFFQRGQRRGSFGSVFEGWGRRISSEDWPSILLFADHEESR